MLYVLLILVLGALVYVGLRAIRTQTSQPKTRTIGPDDDPEFLWRLGRDDNKPR